MDFSEDVSPWYKENRNIIVEKQIRQSSRKTIAKKPSLKRRLPAVQLRNMASLKTVDRSLQAERFVRKHERNASLISTLKSPLDETEGSAGGSPKGFTMIPAPRRLQPLDQAFKLQGQKLTKDQARTSCDAVGVALPPVKPRRIIELPREQTSKLGKSVHPELIPSALCISPACAAQEKCVSPDLLRKSYKAAPVNLRDLSARLQTLCKQTAKPSALSAPFFDKELLGLSLQRKPATERRKLQPLLRSRLRHEALPRLNILPSTRRSNLSPTNDLRNRSNSTEPALSIYCKHFNL